MIGRINWDQDIRSLDDSIVKFFPQIAAAATKVGVGAAKVGVGAAKVGINKVKEKGMELWEPQEEAAQAEKNQAIIQQPQEAEQKTSPMPPEATAGSQIQGFQGNDQPGIPTDQPGANAQAPPTAPPKITKTFFYDNFGIKGGDLLDLLEKAGEESVLPQVIDLLRNEQKPY